MEGSTSSSGARAKGEPAPDVVEVWRVELDLAEEVARPLAAALSPEEVARLRRLSRPDVSRRWLIGRAALRNILGARLKVPPSSVRLSSGDHGRPMLDPNAHGTQLDFNLSHSAALALVAVSARPRVGIDLEWLRRGRDPLPIAERYFSSAELAVLRALPESDRQETFFRHWTGKEALAKGLGLGLRAPLRELELAHGPGGEMIPVQLGRGWRLVQLTDLPSGYCGTLAVDDDGVRVAMRDWSPAG